MGRLSVSARIALLFGLIVQTSAAWAGITAVVPVNPNMINNVQGYTVGWSFTVTQAVQVDALGYFDVGANGLAAAHPVAIWTSSGGAPLVSATVPSGVAGTLDNSFRFISVPLTTLNPGNYVIGGHSPGGDLVADNAASLNVLPQITFGQNLATPVNVAGLTFPTQHYPSQGLGFFGPNFQIIPEPGTLGIVAAASLLALSRRRR